MAINFNIATPGLLANPQPYVNTGLLAAQGPQAAGGTACRRGPADARRRSGSSGGRAAFLRRNRA